MVQVFHDRLLQRFHAAEGTAADSLFRDLRKEPLDLVEPRTTRGDEVKVIVRMTLEPTFHFWRFVCAIVVHDQMDRRTRRLRKVAVDQIEKPDELLLAMPVMAFANDFAGGHIQGREQGSRAVANIVMRVPLRHAGDRKSVV